MKNIKKGLTIVESLIALSVAGTVVTGVIVNEREKAKENNTLNLIHDAMSIVYAVDHRIAIDGYETTNWNSINWNDIDSIYEDLIKKELTSKNLDSCSGGGWSPSIIKEREVTLLECDLWRSIPIKDLNYTASLSKDALTGFIDRFDLTISFDSEESFLENFQDMKYALKNYKRNEYQEITGQHFLTTAELNSGNELSSSECIDSPLNCAFRFTYDISGGNEKIRVDGNNSIINDHLDFIENTASTSPRQCLHWVEKINPSDSSKYWELQKDANSLDCGIGIYEKTPVTADVLAENGSFRTVLLDKECNLLKLNGSKVEIDSGTTTPCGIMPSQDGTEIIQVVENTIARTALINDIFVKKGFVKTLDVDTLTSVTLGADDLFATILNTKIVEVATEMKVSGNLEFNNLVELKNQVEFKKSLATDKNLTIENGLTVKGDTTFENQVDLHNIKINLTAMLSDTEVEGKFEGSEVIAKKIHSDNIETNKATSIIKMKAPEGNFNNITNSIKNINNNIAKMEFVNGYFERENNWVNSSGLYNCTGWSPSTSTKNRGTRFTQTRSCSQNQQKTINTFGNWYNANGQLIGERLESSRTLYNTIRVINSRAATGTKERLVYCNGRYIREGAHCSDQDRGGPNG